MSAHLLVALSDHHFPHHHPVAWEKALCLLDDIRPTIEAHIGDLADLEMLSRYKLGKTAHLQAVEQVACAAAELNRCRSISRAKLQVVMPGNHDDRWENIYGNYTPFLRGAKGLSLKDQFYAQGLDRRTRWVSESTDCPGFEIKAARLLLRHGHRQATGYGIKNIASAELSRFPSHRSIVGHHHRAQMMFHTELGVDAWAVTNPHLSGDHDYNITPNWQRGLTVVTLYGHKDIMRCTGAYPQLALFDEKKQVLVFNGKTY